MPKVVNFCFVAIILLSPPWFSFLNNPEKSPLVSLRNPLGGICYFLLGISGKYFVQFTLAQMVCLQLSCGQRINCGVNDGNQRTENHRTKVKAAGCVINLTIDNCTCSSGKNHVAEHHICFPVGECTNTAASAIQHNIVDQHYNNRSESVARVVMTRITFPPPFE